MTFWGAQTELLTQAAQLALEDRDYATAEQRLASAVEIARRADLPREEAEALIGLSRLYRETNQPAKAATNIDQGIATLLRVEEAYDLPIFLAEKAQVQSALGALAAADQLYGQATDLVEGLLINAQSSRVKTSMIGAMSDIYIGHFRLAWDRLHNPEKAFQIIESARGRVLLDSIRYSRETDAPHEQTSAEQEIARLQRSLLHESLTASQTRRVLARLDDAYFRLSPIEYTRSRKEVEILRRPPVSLAALRRQLAPHETLVEFVIDTKTSYALRVTQAGLTIHTLPGRAQIEQMVGQFLSAVKNKRDAVAAGQDLFRRALAASGRRSDIVADHRARRPTSPAAVWCTCGRERGNLESTNHDCGRPFGDDLLHAENGTAGRKPQPPVLGCRLHSSRPGGSSGSVECPRRLRFAWCWPRAAEIRQGGNR